MFKKLFSIIAVSLCILAYFNNSAKAESYFEIVGIKNLKNTDIKKNGKTDPYIVAKVKTKSGWKTVVTPTKWDTLNPIWNFKFTTDEVVSPQSYNPNFINIKFEVWDEDPVFNKLLGKLETRVSQIGSSNTKLILHKRGWWFNWYAGSLIVKRCCNETCSTPKVKIPNIVGLPLTNAQGKLEKIKFKLSSRAILTENSLLDGKVVSQNPKAGAVVNGYCWSPEYVHVSIGEKPTYRVTNVLGQIIQNARKMLRTFRNIQVKRIDSPTSNDWFKIIKQEPVGTKVYREAKIQLTMAIPPNDFKFTVPDILNKKINDAIRDLRENHLDRIKIIKYRTAVKEENGIVLKQEPESKAKVGIAKNRRKFSRMPWTIDTLIQVTVGWYADGKSLYAASPVGFDKDVKFKFDEPDTARFYFFDVKKKGYLIVENKKSVSQITPKADYYMLENGVYEEKNKYSSWTPSSFRVIPGKWVIKIYPEGSESKSDENSTFAFHFIKEFDDGEPNDFFEQAVNIPLYSDIIIGTLGGRLANSDFFRFETKEPGYMEITYKQLPLSTTFYGNSKNSNLQFDMYNSSGEGLGLYYPPAAPRFMLPGEYSIGFNTIERLWNNIPYKLSFTFHKAQDKGEPNDTQETAYKVNIPASIPVAYTSRGDNDFYILTSKKPGYAILSHNRDLPFDTNFNSYDKNGKSDKYFGNLPSAVYIDKTKLVRIHAVNEEKYTIDNLPMLNINFIPASEDKYEPNDDIKNAARIQLNKKIEALLMPRDDSDNYKFSIKKTGKIKIAISNPCDIPVKGKILSPDGKIFKDRIYFPFEISIPKGDYILQFGQEGGFTKFCGERYKLEITTQRRK